MVTAGCGHGQGQREMFLNQSPMAWDGTLHLLSVLKCHPEQNPIETLIRAKASRPECVIYAYFCSGLSPTLQDGNAPEQAPECK